MADHTTLEVGGPARWFVECDSHAAVRYALAWARQRTLPTFVLGGGSNLLVSDDGFDGLVLRPTMDDVTVQQSGEHVQLRVGAGMVWDALVERAVASGWAGLECLSGIPGNVGAAPIQNIGAYGQEVSETIVAVTAMDRASGEIQELPATSLQFGYRNSRFKGQWRDRYVILSVDFRLAIKNEGAVRYPGLRAQLGLGDGDPAPTLEAVRQGVLEVRRQKSMVLDPDDPNRRSAGSFFVNPVVGEAKADAVAAKARARGTERDLPRYPAPAVDGEARVKLSAAWLIEEAGFQRGFGEGAAGLSSRHTLALVNRGGATARDLLDLARTIQDGVYNAFAVELTPEPLLLGF